MSHPIILKLTMIIQCCENIRRHPADILSLTLVSERGFEATSFSDNTMLLLSGNVGYEPIQQKETKKTNV